MSASVTQMNGMMSEDFLTLSKTASASWNVFTLTLGDIASWAKQRHEKFKHPYSLKMHIEWRIRRWVSLSVSCFVVRGRHLYFDSLYYIARAHARENLVPDGDLPTPTKQGFPKYDRGQCTGSHWCIPILENGSDLLTSLKAIWF